VNGAQSCELCRRDSELALGVAESRLRLIAARIGDPRYRKSFLQNVPENAATMALAADEPANPGDVAGPV